MRATSGTVHNYRRKKILKRAKGFRGARSRIQSSANQAVMKSGMHGFASRRQKKREMRSLWVIRINAAVRSLGLSYSRFIDNLNKAGVKMDRRMLADLALNDMTAFTSLVETTRR
jgi:large subunit ribosomal protein L20